ncbi:hypothetical protein ACVWYG_000798 [Pedobacter sp. UYEF25]
MHSRNGLALRFISEFTDTYWSNACNTLKAQIRTGLAGQNLFNFQPHELHKNSPYSASHNFLYGCLFQQCQKTNSYSASKSKKESTIYL